MDTPLPHELMLARPPAREIRYEANLPNSLVRRLPIAIKRWKKEYLYQPIHSALTRKGLEIRAFIMKGLS